MSIRKTIRTWTRQDGTVVTRSYDKEYCIDCCNQRDRENRRAFNAELNGEFISVPKSKPRANKVSRVERAKDRNVFWFSDDLNIWQHGPNKVRWNRIYKDKKALEEVRHPWDRI